MSGVDEKIKKLSDKKRAIQLKEKLLLEKEKRKRVKKFQDVGRIAYSANIDRLDKELLLGAFIEISNLAKEDIHTERWRNSAKAFLNSSGENNEVPITISFEKPPEKETKEKLKEMKFKWNSFRREYYGYGTKKDVEASLEGLNVLIECHDAP